MWKPRMHTRRIALVLGLIIVFISLLSTTTFAVFYTEHSADSYKIEKGNYYKIVASMWFGSKITSGGDGSISFRSPGASGGPILAQVDNKTWPKEKNYVLTGTGYTNNFKDCEVHFHKINDGITLKNLHYKVVVYDLDGNEILTKEDKYYFNGSPYDNTFKLILSDDKFSSVTFPLETTEHKITAFATDAHKLPELNPGGNYHPKKTGYTWDGIFTYNGTTIYSINDDDKYIGGTAAIPNNTELVAPFTANKYDITFQKDGGTGGTDSTIATYDSPMPSISLPTKIGYVFDGYYGFYNGIGTCYYDKTGTSQSNWDEASNKSLYANWTKNPTPTITSSNKTVTYNGNTIDVSSMFTLPPGVGTATYSIIDGGTGAGTISGNTLTVTKAGTIKIKVATAKSTTYWLGSKIATLTVNKGATLSTGFTVTAYDGVYDGNSHSVATASTTNESYTAPTITTTIENVGTQDYSITFTSPLYGDKTFTGSAQVTSKSIDGATIGAFGLTYTGSAQTPNATVTVNGLTATGDWSEVTTVGQTTTFTATGNFTGTTAAVNPNMAQATYDMSGVVFDDDDAEYDGEAHTITATQLPTGVSATYAGSQIIVGTSIVTASFTGDTTNYQPIADKTATITVIPRVYDNHKSEFTTSVLDSSYTFTDSPIAPTPTVSWNGTQITDFDYGYEDNTAAGTATIQIKFKGNFSGQMDVEFTIGYASLPSGGSYFTTPATTNDWYQGGEGFAATEGNAISTDPSAFPGVVTIPTTDTGAGELTFYVKDSSGKIYQTKFPYKVDDTDPTIDDAITGNPTDWTKSNATIGFTAGDALSGVDSVVITKDGATIDADATGGSFTATENGTYTITVTDTAGNVTTKDVVVDKIDKTEPEASITTASSTVWTKDNVTIDISATDDHLEKWEYTLNGTDWILGTDTSFTISSSGNHTNVQIRATDEAGNVTTSSAITVKLDKIEPTPVVTTPPSESGTSLHYVFGNDETQLSGTTYSGTTAGITVDSDGNATVTAPGTYTITATSGAGLTNTTTITVHSVTFDGENTQLVNAGDLVTSQTATDKTGYKFDKWMNGSGPFGFATAINANYILTSAWTLEVPTVTVADITGTYKASAFTTTAVPSNDAAVTYTYKWIKQGSTTEVSSSDILSVTDVADTGTYDVTITATDGDGLTSNVTQPVSVTIDKAPVTFAVTDNTPTYDKTDKTATVAQTATETVKIASDGYTVAYVENSAEVTPKDAGDYDVVVTITDDNFSLTTAKVGTLTIKPKPITAQWTGLTHVYDTTEKLPTFDCTGVETGDSVNITLVNDAGAETTYTDAGSYTITAKSNNDNYVITNPNATLVIQKAPITFTVDANGNVTADPSFSGYTVSYVDKDGKTSTVKPTASGTYTVVVTMDDGVDDNHRINGTGVSSSTVGQLTIGATPKTFDVTFSEKTNYSNCVEGSVMIVPEGVAVGGKVFTGWLYNGKLYQPGNTFTVTSEAVFKAEYADEVYRIGGIVDKEGTPLENAVVTLMRGSQQISEPQLTNANGEYAFDNVPAGTYNIVATCNGITMTKLVIIVKENHDNEHITMPAGKTNSIVEVTAGTPSVVVGGLDQEFTPTEIADTKNNGTTVELKLTVTETATQVPAIVEKAPNVGMYLDIGIAKTVKDSDGNVTHAGTVDESTNLLEIIIPIPGELQGKASYTIYRMHGGNPEPDVITQGTTGERLERHGNEIHLFAKKFSTYALTYTNPTSGGTSSYGSGVTSAQNGTVTVSGDRNKLGSTVTITPTPDAGYQVSDITVTYASGREVTVTDNGDGTYSYKQPGASVNVHVTFVKEGQALTPTFSDVSDTAWYYDAVQWAVETGITAGFADGSFQPYGITNRAQAVTFLWRMAGCPESTFENPFVDVSPEAYYYDAVRWAVEQGITLGTTATTFSPNMDCSRAHILTFLWRSTGKNVVTGENPFADVNTNNYYYNAVLWAVDEAITSGTTPTTFSPDKDCTRAEIVTFLYRCLEK